MKSIHSGYLSQLFVISALSAGAFSGFAQGVPDGVYVRDGYELTLAIDNLENARFLEVDPDGTLYVSRPKIGQIAACRDKDGDGVYETITAFVEGHPTAHGMQWHDGWLWFSITDGILKARDTDGDGVADETVEVLPKGSLPGGTGHWWRAILIHNGRLYTSVGDPGNATPEDIERKKLWTYNLDGSDKKLFATGIRNTEEYVIRPGTDEIWGMDHNSDWFGRPIESEKRGAPQPITDVYPPEELNLYEEGNFYGHPFIVGHGLPRYEFMDRDDIVELAEKTTAPKWFGGPHWAANGMHFYTGEQFPDGQGDAFIAYHGSWNRTKKGGYCVTRILFDRGLPYGELTYVSFLTEDERVLGRPVDVEQEKDGSLLISDDSRGKVYRLRYTGGN